MPRTGEILIALLRNGNSQVIQTKEPQLERRKFGRRKFYSSDDVRASLRGPGLLSEAVVTDLSPAGAAVALPLAKLPSASASRTSVQLGLELEVLLKMNPRAAPLALRAVVVFVEEGKISGKKMLRIGLSFVGFSRDLSPSPKTAPKTDRRTNARFVCSDFLVPSLWCEHPWLYQEKILFRVTAFGENSIVLETSARNKILFKGMEVNACLSFPGQNPVPCCLIISRVGSIAGCPERFRVTANFLKISEELGRTICGYCLMVNPHVSLTDLRRAGFVLGAVNSVAVCDYVHNEADLRQVFKLRGDTDAFDKWARQIMCKVGGKIVGCARLLFNEGKRERSEVAGKALLPADLWNEGFLEVSRIAVRTDFADTDVLLELLRFVVNVALLSQSRYLLMECTDVVLLVLQEMGAQKMNLRLSRNNEHGEIANIVRWDCKALRAGWGGQPVQWATAFGPVLRSLAKRGIAPVASRARIRMALERYAQTDSGKSAIQKRGRAIDLP